MIFGSDKVFWWSKKDDKEVVDGLFKTAELLLNDNATSYDRYDEFVRLYGTDPTPSFIPSNIFKPESLELFFQDGVLKMNILRPIIDAMIARIATNKIKIRFLTSGGSYSDRRRAERITKAISALSFISKEHFVSQLAFRDALIYGTGFTLPFETDNFLRLERLNPKQVLVDQSCVTDPVNWYQVKRVDKNVLVDYFSARMPKWNDKKAEIIKNSSTRLEKLYSDEYNRDEDNAVVIEAWHCSPSDGRHIIACTAGILFDEPWRQEKSPICSIRYKEPMKGWLGDSLMDELGEFQKEVDFILLKIQELTNLGSVNILVDRGAQMSVEKIADNRQLKVLEYNGRDGRAPTIFVVPTQINEYFDQIERLRNWASATVGINELFLEAAKPAGIDSGRGIREMADLNSARFLHLGQKYQEFRKDLAERQVELMRNIKRRNGSITIFNDEIDSLNEIDLEDFNLEKDSYVLKSWAVNLLPDDPAGQLEQMQNYIQGDPALAVRQMSYLDYPDVAAVVRRQMAPYLYIEKIIDDMVIKGKFTPPNEFMDLKYGQEQMQLAYNECALLGEDDDVLEMMVQWTEQAMELQNIGAPTQPMGMPDIPGMPPGIPPEMMGMNPATQIPQESNAMGVPPEQIMGGQAMGQVL